MPSLNVSLCKDLIDFVEHEVALGDYTSQSEVVRDALTRLYREKELEQEQTALLRQAIGVGMDDLAQGRMATRTIDQIADDVDLEVPH